MEGSDEPISPTTMPSRHSPPKSTPVLVVLAKLAAFTDAFVSGLFIPLIPSIIRTTKIGISDTQVQIWTSVFIAAYGCVFVAASPFLPLFWSSRARIWMSLILGLALAAASITLLATAADLVSLGIARVCQGLSGVLITGACAGLMSISARRNSEPSALSWMNISFIQAAAMVVAPAVAGLLYDHLGGLWTVSYYAYAILALNGLIVLVGFKLYGKTVRASRQERGHLLASEGGLQSYGTVAAEQHDRGMSVELAGVPASVNASSVVTLGGCIMVTLLHTALQSVLPIWAEQAFNWPVSTIGFMFVALFLPATVVGPAFNLAVAQKPDGTRYSRYLTAWGFLSCVPAFLLLGAFSGYSPTAEVPVFLVLSAISLGTGLCAGILFGQTTPSTASQTPLTAGERSSAAVQSTSVPSIASAWGTLLGPLVAGAVHLGWGWMVMTQVLGALSALSGIAVLLFLNGWIGSRQGNYGTPRARSAIDEESAPMLAASLANAGDCSVTPKGGTYAGTDDSGSLDTTLGKHRRHFSADNFSIASTEGSHEVSQVRFHASLDLPNNGPDDPASRRSSRGSSINTERRFHMREAPHTPATDPLLAAGNRYVIDETPSTDASNGAKEKRKRHVVVFPEEEVSPELLQRRKHHVVTINSLDGSFKLVSNPTVDQVSMQINEEMEPASAESPGALRRYVVIVLNDGETGIDITGGESE